MQSLFYFGLTIVTVCFSAVGVNGEGPVLFPPVAAVNPPPVLITRAPNPPPVLITRAPNPPPVLIPPSKCITEYLANIYIHIISLCASMQTHIIIYTCVHAYKILYTHANMYYACH